MNLAEVLGAVGSVAALLVLYFKHKNKQAQSGALDDVRKAVDKATTGDTEDVEDLLNE